jgi:hypothetical protein
VVFAAAEHEASFGSTSATKSPYKHTWEKTGIIYADVRNIILSLPINSNFIKQVVTQWLAIRENEEELSKLTDR